MKYTYLMVLLILMITACSKSYLETSPSHQFAKPDDLTRLKNLLNNDILFGETPVLGEESADDHYFTDDYYKNLSEQDKNVYTWKKDLFPFKTNIPDYNIPYTQVFTCNLVLEGLSKIEPGIFKQDWNETKGIALFMRSYAFFNLSQTFAAAYDESEPGISLPLSTDISVVPPRSSMKQTFDQIITDLNKALLLLPRSVTTRSLPSKPAVFALLARTYLSKRDYRNAYDMADSCIHLQDSLLDFYSINRSPRFPIPAGNKEILYESWLSSASNVILGRKYDCLIDPTLYNSYDSNDLRKELFFMLNPDGQPVFKNNGTGKAFAFSGLSIPEMYLIRAECAARSGDLDLSMNDIYTLQEKRYKKGTAVRYSASSYLEAMTIILRERRKELCFRGLRWADLKRLNKEEAAIVLTRSINGNTYQLLPKSNHYVFPIPDDALSGGTITPNIRD